MFFSTQTRKLYCAACKQTIDADDFPAIQYLYQFPSAPVAVSPAYAPSSHPSRPTPALGLVNVANTCYINSVLQAVAHVPCLAGFFQCFHLLLTTLPPPPRPAPRLDTLRHHYLSALTRLIAAMTHPAPDDSAAIKPAELTHLVQTLHPIFRGMDQHDAQEALHAIIQLTRDALTTGLGYDPIIQHVVEGRSVSTTKCLECGTEVSRKEDPFIDLSLPFPTSGKATLEGMVKAYCTAATVRAQCPYCSAETRQKHRVELSKIPSVLIFHMKRFRQVGGSVEKILDSIQFPLKGLNMGSFLMNTGTVKDDGPTVSQILDTDSDPNLNESAKSIFHDAIYDCVSVVNHAGKFGSGHYTAMGLVGSSQWFEYNDTDGKAIGPGSVVGAGADAYLLVYTRRSTAAQLSVQAAVSETLSTPHPSIEMSMIPAAWTFRLVALPTPGPVCVEGLTCPRHTDISANVGPWHWWAAGQASERISGQFPPFTVVPKACGEMLTAIYGGDTLPEFDGNVRCVGCVLDERRRKERAAVGKLDYSPRTQLTSAVPADWLASWVAFINGGEAPSVLDSTGLAAAVEQGTAEAGRDYRLIHPKAAGLLRGWYGAAGRVVGLSEPSGPLTILN